MRALVISDTHFGAWTGEDILREPGNLALLAPHLDVDEVIMLGDLFDLLFACSRDAFTAAEGRSGGATHGRAAAHGRGRRLVSAVP